MPVLQLEITGDVAAGVDLLTLVRTDTGAAVPFGAAAFVDAGGGAWTHSFTAPASGLTYAHTYLITWPDGDTTPGNGSYTDAADSYAGRYTTQSAVEAWLKNQNTDVYADLDGDRVADAGVWRQVIEWGEDTLDLEAGGGPAEVPFGYDGGTAAQQGVAQRTVKRWATKLAGIELAGKRVPLSKEQRDVLAADRADVLAEIRRWRAGGTVLPGLTPAAAADDTPEPGQFQFVPIDRGNGRGGDEFSTCW